MRLENVSAINVTVAAMRTSAFDAERYIAGIAQIVDPAIARVVLPDEQEWARLSYDQKRERITLWILAEEAYLEEVARHAAPLSS